MSVRGICLIVFVLCATSLITAHRAGPNDHTHTVETELFTCKSSKEQIPLSSVNDDFCDCKDGTDEPDTSACSGVLLASASSGFLCSNKGYKPHYIPSSFVKDGICDCCDGSDEVTGSTQCLNTCKQAGKQELLKMKKELFAHEQGIVKKKAMIAEANVKFPMIQAELEQAQTLHDELQVEVQALDAETERLRQLKDLANADNLVDNPTGENEWEREDEEVEDRKLDNINRSFDEALQERKQRFTEEHQISPDDIENKITELNRQSRDARRKMEDAAQQVESKRKILNTNFGPNKEFFALYGTEWKTTHQEYTYSLKPFEDVHQSKTHVGNWDSWEQEFTKMKYTGGKRCWGHGDRSALVNVECGVENGLSNVDEPHPCYYTFTLQTPAACSEEHAETLRRVILDNFGEDALESEPEPEPKRGWFF